MTDRELDRMMQHVLLDAIKRDCEKETDDVPAFKPTHHYQRQMAEMLKDPLKWERRRARPLWKNVAQKAAVILLVFSLSLGSLMAVSPTVRAAVVRWVTEWYETYIQEKIFREKCHIMKFLDFHRAIQKLSEMYMKLLSAWYMSLPMET